MCNCPFCSVYQNVSSVGKDAVEAIGNYKEIVSDLDAAVSTIATANQLILGVQSNFSGDGFSKLQEKYSAEKASSDILRQQIMELDYGPQGCSLMTLFIFLCYFFLL